MVHFHFPTHGVRSFVFRTVLVCTLITIPAFAQQKPWDAFIAGAGREYVTDVLVDDAGNSFVGGYYNANIIITGGHKQAGLTLALDKLYPSDAGSDCFVAKYSGGSLQWILRFGSQGNDGSFLNTGPRLALDPAGNLIVASTLNAGEVRFGLLPSTVTTVAGYNTHQDVLVMTLDANGSPFRWKMLRGNALVNQIYERPGGNFAYPVTEDIVMTGLSITDSIHICGYVKYPFIAGDWDGFVVTLPIDLNITSAMNVATYSTGDERTNAADVNAGGEIVFTGHFNNRLSFAGRELQNPKQIGLAGYVALTHPDMTHQGVQLFASTGSANDLFLTTRWSADAQGVYVGGGMSGEYSFPRGKFQSNGGYDGLLMLLNRSLGVRWHAQIASAGEDLINDMQINACDSSVTVVGQCGPQASIVTTPLVGRRVTLRTAAARSTNALSALFHRDGRLLALHVDERAQTQPSDMSSAWAVSGDAIAGHYFGRDRLVENPPFSQLEDAFLLAGAAAAGCDRTFERPSGTVCTSRPFEIRMPVEDAFMIDGRVDTTSRNYRLLADSPHPDSVAHFSFGETGMLTAASVTTDANMVRIRFTIPGNGQWIRPLLRYMLRYTRTVGKVSMHEFSPMDSVSVTQGVQLARADSASTPCRLTTARYSVSTEAGATVTWLVIPPEAATITPVTPTASSADVRWAPHGPADAVIRAVVTMPERCADSVSWNASPAIPVSVRIDPPGPFCVGQPVRFSAVPDNAGPFDWEIESDAGTMIAFTNTVHPTMTWNTAANRRVVLRSRAECVESDTLLVAIATTAPPDVTGDRVVCVGDSVRLSVPDQPGQIVEWWRGGAVIGTEVTLRLPAIQSGTDSVRVTVRSASGCSGERSVAITVTERPVVVVTVENPIACLGSSVTVRASGSAASYTWLVNDTVRAGVNGAEFVWTPTRQGRFVVAARAGSGACSDLDSVVMTVSVRPTVSLDPVPATACLGQDIQLRANSTGNVFAWYVNDTLQPGATGAVFTASLLRLGMSRITVIAGSGECRSADSVEVMVLPGPTPTLAITTARICAGATVDATTTASPSQVTWSVRDASGAIVRTESGFDRLTHAFAVPGTYTIRLRVESNGCVSERDTSIIVNSRPTASILGDTVLCTGGTASLTAAPDGMTYRWLINGVVVRTEQSFVLQDVTDSRRVQLIVMNAEGCADTTSRALIVTIPAIPVLTPAAPSVCLGEDIVIRSSISSGTFYWTVDGVERGAATGPELRLPTTTADTRRISLRLVTNGCEARSNEVQVTVRAPLADLVIDTVTAHVTRDATARISVRLQNVAALDGPCAPSGMSMTLRYNATMFHIKSVEPSSVVLTTGGTVAEGGVLWRRVTLTSTSLPPLREGLELFTLVVKPLLGDAKSTPIELVDASTSADIFSRTMGGMVTSGRFTLSGLAEHWGSTRLLTSGIPKIHSLHPSPVVDKVNVLVEHPSSGRYHVAVHSMLGEVLHEESYDVTVQSDGSPINRALILRAPGKAGVYMLSISNGLAFDRTLFVVAR